MHWFQGAAANACFSYWLIWWLFPQWDHHRFPESKVTSSSCCFVQTIVRALIYVCYLLHTLFTVLYNKGKQQPPSLRRSYHHVSAPLWFKLDCSCSPLLSPNLPLPPPPPPKYNVCLLCGAPGQHLYLLFTPSSPPCVSPLLPNPFSLAGSAFMSRVFPPLPSLSPSFFTCIETDSGKHTRAQTPTRTAVKVAFCLEDFIGVAVKFLQIHPHTHHAKDGHLYYGLDLETIHRH